MQKSDTLRLVGFYQIIGGIIGWLSAGLTLIIGESQSKNMAAVVVLGLSLFNLSIACGWLLLTRRKLGMSLSIINQGLQVLMLGLSSFLFKYSSGIYLTLGIDVLDDIKLKADVGTSLFHLNINSGEQWEVSVNLVAVCLLAYLLRLQEKRNEYNISTSQHKTLFP